MVEQTGYDSRIFHNDELELFYSGELNPLAQMLPENSYYVLLNEDKQPIDKYVIKDSKFVKVPFTVIGDKLTGIIKPRNLEQELAFHMLKDSDSTVKLLTGGYGTGKTMALIVAALELVNAGKFDRVVWIRNNIEVKDTNAIGSLPGTEFDKLLPYAMPFADHVGGVDGVKSLIEENKLEIQHLGFLRGRDIRNAIIISSEIENLTKEHIQLLIGRVGEGSNLWMDGDLKQRDKMVFEKSSGVETLIDRLIGNPLFGHVKLQKSERSATARLADLLD